MKAGWHLSLINPLEEMKITKFTYLISPLPVMGKTTGMVDVERKRCFIIRMPYLSIHRF